ncbi:unnamed protein product [Soboliphyme baturini]|uniref:tRNA (guanine-N(7)-)-methyltransferase n=1 Tax=Soboliphyme baturini TaxID=241478 RepID=A0A183J4U7_9BILA|nr:unnamed protein product [Soboliphyme baturini]
MVLEFRYFSPACPEEFDWSSQFEEYCFRTDSEHDKQREVQFVDVGCGYGGLLVSLSTLFPETLMVGLEIRVKVSKYVMERIRALRSQHPGQYGNITCLRTNAMKYLPNYFKKNQLTKMFFLYPDPHFKKAKHKWRIISNNLLDEYAYFLGSGGVVYTITDVKEVFEWNVNHFSAHPMFERVSDAELSQDPVFPLLFESTEEGAKVTRNKGSKFHAVFRKRMTLNLDT